MLTVFRRKKPIPQLPQPKLPMVDYSHVAYRLEGAKKIGKITYVDITREGTILYVNSNDSTIQVQSHQIINTFGTVK